MFALEASKIMQAKPPKVRREMGMCAIVIYVRTAVVVFCTRYLIYEYS